MKTLRKEILSRLDIEEYYKEQLLNRKIKKENDNWHLTNCPLHEDKNPSFGFNKEHGGFRCFGCGQKGTLFKFDALIHNIAEDGAVKRLAKKVGVDVLPTFNNTLENRVKKYHQNLLDNKENSLDKVKELGICEEVIKRLQIGYMPSYRENPARIIFPIFDPKGKLFTLKKYSNEAGVKEKCKFENGGKNSLYGIHQLNGNSAKTVILCAGEKDKAVAESYLGEDFVFTTFIAGEGSIPKGIQLEETKKALTGRDLVILYDADKAGQDGAVNVAQAFASISRTLRLGKWPHEFTSKFPKGDISDFLIQAKHDKDHLVQIIKEAHLFQKDESSSHPVYKQCGPITEHKEGYQRVRMIRGEELHTPLSNFTIIPKTVIEIDNTNEVLQCCFLYESKEQYVVILEKKNWSSRKNFIERLPSHQLWFAGTDRDIQYIKGITIKYEVNMKKGTNLLGYVTNQNGLKSYTLPDRTISLTPGNEHSIEYVHPLEGNPLESMFEQTIEAEDEKSFFTKLFPLLYEIHEKVPLLCILGWFCATPFKPQIIKQQGHFPILNVFGTKGSGKTTLLASLLKLFGFKGSMYGCSLTEFRLVRLLSSTNCFPICFDEFKTSDLHPMYVDLIKQIVRKVYNQSIEIRGKSDQSIVEYSLDAPIIICGESTFQDTAILERIVPVNLSFRSLNQERKNAYEKLKKIHLQSFLPSYLKWCLEQDQKVLWEIAKQKCEKVDSLQNSPERIKDNVSTIFFGLEALNAFATQKQFQPVIYKPKEVIQYFLEEVTEEKKDRIALDYLLIKLASMAERECGRLTQNLDFKVDSHLLYLRLNQCVDQFRCWAGHFRYTGEVLDYKSYQKMLKERLGIYVEKTNFTKSFQGRKVKCVVINIKHAEKFGLELQGFIKPKEKQKR